MLRIADIQRQLKVSRPTIYKWIKQGLPVVKVGGLIFVEEKELNKFLKKGE